MTVVNFIAVTIPHRRLTVLRLVVLYLAMTGVMMPGRGAEEVIYKCFYLMATVLKCVPRALEVW